MSSRRYETAADFCKLVGTPDLLEYLSIGPDTPTAEAQAKLKARRKYMQGMQSNPKYKKEALFLIKHYSALSGSLEDPADYLADALRRAESVHLPILEMTIKGVLAGGALSTDQEAYLRRNANELGISDVSFDKLMDQLCEDSGVPRPGDPSRTRPSALPTVPPMPTPGDDFYKLLRIDRRATLPEIRTAYEARMKEAKAAPRSSDNEALIVRLDLAWSVLSDPMARDQYVLSQSRTGPPARARDSRPGEIETAPPIRARASAPPHMQGAQYSPPGGGGSRLEILGNPERELSIGSGLTQASITIRNGGDQPMTGRISSDQPWLQVSPRQIDASATTQEIQVIVDPAQLAGKTGTAAVSVVTDRGEKGVITFHVKRGNPKVMMGVGAAVLVVLAGAAYAMMIPAKYDLKLEVDPWAHEVIVEGQSLGPGSSFHLPGLTTPTLKVEVKHPNFKPYSRELTAEDLEDGHHDIQLELNRKMDFKPSKKLKRSSVNQHDASRVVGALGPSINECLSIGGEPGSMLTGSIRVYIDKQGQAAGINVEGSRAEESSVQNCLKRQAAAALFDELTDGDYATVRYEYAVTVPTKPE